ncbi:OsmC family protein [Amycolatopsis regifaucium]|uniref:Peroxiredoxin n=1 Tax=Amycolatopsis regifaucium TaxID=546365 RepID=A0A154MB42_9PSEU|nr:OsmC family protein [Amycolatopsis regifaucium]KZB81500.1 peroxiredoxin [Amycolatopsis regifaucium]OKA06930.1 peroxiredoxin [Amycolatopsis regifaucium]SFH29873.1 Organic hydroperoxide reductase OsmC/OhrA [Amycolatopsis regifaucium]
MTKSHHYIATVRWTGNTGSGTTGYRDFSRDHEISAGSKPMIPGTADPAFRGLPERWNPEELLIVSLSQCHMLWYLVLCAREGIVVTEYSDSPSGTMVENAAGGGRFEEAVLRPLVKLASPADRERALAVHEEAHKLCFIANSVNFEVRTEPAFADD